MTNAARNYSLTLPRNAFTALEVPRAGDVWRLCQDVATLASIDAGWPPSRFRDERVAFIVYRMTVVHERATEYGAELDAITWVSALRRRTLCTREIRVHHAGERVAGATQEWVHVDFDTMKPKQGDPDTAAAFRPTDVEPSVRLPQVEAADGQASEFSFEMWQTWADPLAHANHPAYVDWCDEATSRHMVQAGLDPVHLRPIAERVSFKSAVLPGQRVSVATRLAGVVADEAVVLRHELRTEEGRAAEATTVRGLRGGNGASLIAAWS